MASWEKQAHTLSPVSPRNVEQITNASQDYEYNAQVPVRYWLRTASALLKEAEIYMREGDEETTYLLLYRHAHLILAHLQVHPEAKSAGVLNQAKKDVNKNLKTLDLLKPRINQRYERYSSSLRDRQARLDTVQTERNAGGAAERNSQHTAPPAQQLHGHEHSKLAVELAHRERHRRAGTNRGNTQVQTSKSDVSKQVQTIQLLAQRNRISEQDLADHSSQQATTYSYPSVRNLQLQATVEPQAFAHKEPLLQPRNAPPALPPALPPKSLLPSTELHPPPRPDKVGAPPESPDTQSAPAYTFATTATLENGTPLRTLFLPPTLRTTFLRLAHKNTLANLETCAFLAGTLISNALFVSKLIVPAQVATSDTCEMTNESQLFDYVDNEKDLMVLGWIHTHPTQTCFMSSRDLHTHAGYQMMLAESIAIVCAPSKGDTSHGGDWGAYRLTDPPGKMAILNCDRPGVFHPHDVDNIYTDALRPGHVVEANGLEFEVVDLRNT